MASTADSSFESTSSSASTGTATTVPHMEVLTTESVYEFYSQQLFPALVASVPMLARRLLNDLRANAVSVSRKAIEFLKPSWVAENAKRMTTAFPKANHTAVVEVITRYFDAIKEIPEESGLTRIDISRAKEHLHHLEELVMKAMTSAGPTGFHWFQQAWPMMDWKVGVFLWRSCGGILFLIGIATIIPGRLHGVSGRILRWPILGITYLLIAVEFAVYVIIRLFIRVAETLVANPKHRKWRQQMAVANSYSSWYQIAKQLDHSKGRDKWQRNVEDETTMRYNWSYIKELIVDLRAARHANDAVFGLAVLSQCSRKNVGGVMEPDLFSFTHSGETKHIVVEFIQEVALTLRWVTGIAKNVKFQNNDEDHQQQQQQEEWVNFETKFKHEVKVEKEKLNHNFIEWFLSGALSLLPKESKETEQSEDEARATEAVTASPESSLSAYSSNIPESIPKNISGTVIDVSHQPEIEDTVRSFLKRARAAYGRTALCLSGGGMMANCHYGVIKALLEQDCLPHIISGTSAGSVVGSLVCTRTDDELMRDLDPEILAPKQGCFSRSWMERAKSVYHTGHMFDGEEWYQMILWFTCGEMTFEEAYKKTGRVLCISLSATTKKAPPVLLNYITAPNVVIASAIIASAAVPGFITPVRLRVKNSQGIVKAPMMDKGETYWDGSIQQDIPTSGLAEMLNCQFFVASQCNPHIVPFFFNTKGDVGRPCRWSGGLQRDSWRGGFLLSALEMYIKNDMRAKFRFLHDLEAAVGFTSSLFTQSTYGGQTTIVPELAFPFYLKIFTNPSLEDMKEYFRVGLSCTYPHIQMIKLHYEIAKTLDECLVSLESESDGKEVNIGETGPNRSEQVGILIVVVECLSFYHPLKEMEVNYL